MSEDAPIRGVYAALPTVFDERRNIDTQALDKLLDYLIDRTLHGLALLTEAAEDPLLSQDERRTLIRVTTERLKGKKPFVVCVSAAATMEAVDLARFAESKGAKAIVLSPYRLPGLAYRELYRHVDRVVRSVGIPVLLTDRPNGALDSLEPEEASTLSAHSGLCGVFAPHARPEELKVWVHRFKGRDASVLSGSSLTLGRDIQMGVSGAICGMAVVVADTARKLWEAIQKGQTTTVAEIESTASPVVDLLAPEPTPLPPEGMRKLATKLARRSLKAPRVPLTFHPALIKEALRLQGHSLRTEVRPPYENLKAEARERLVAVLRKGGALS